MIFSDCDSLEYIHVDCRNPYYSSGNGALCSKEKKEKKIRFVPPGMSGMYRIPDDVTAIDGQAFKNCSRITEIFVPENLSKVSEYGGSFFSGCSSLKYIHVDVRNPYYTSGNGALCSREKEKKKIIFVPPGMSGMYIIPDDVTAIDDQALKSCSEITEIFIPKNLSKVHEIYKGCYFKDCSSLKYIHVDVRNPYYASGNGALCSNDKEGNKILFVPPGMSGMYRIPESATAIDGIAFKNCSHLTAIYIPKNMWDIHRIYEGSYFAECSSLTRFEVADDHNCFVSIDGVVYSKGMEEIEYVPPGRKGTFTIPDTVRIISSGAFQGCIGLEKIILPPSIRFVDMYTFAWCTALREIELPYGIKEIDYRAFACCKQLRKITIPNNVNLISQEAFAGCTALEEIDIPESVTYIGFQAFGECTKLTKATLTTQIIDLGDWFDFNWSGEKLDWTQEQEAVAELRTFVFNGCATNLEINVRKI